MLKKIRRAKSTITINYGVYFCCNNFGEEKWGKWCVIIMSLITHFSLCRRSRSDIASSSWYQYTCDALSNRQLNLAVPPLRTICIFVKDSSSREGTSAPEKYDKKIRLQNGGFPTAPKKDKSVQPAQRHALFKTFESVSCSYKSLSNVTEWQRCLVLPSKRDERSSLGSKWKQVLLWSHNSIA